MNCFRFFFSLRFVLIKRVISRERDVSLEAFHCVCAFCVAFRRIKICIFSPTSTGVLFFFLRFMLTTRADLQESPFLVRILGVYVGVPVLRTIKASTHQLTASTLFLPFLFLVFLVRQGERGRLSSLGVVQYG